MKKKFTKSGVLFITVIAMFFVVGKNGFAYVDPESEPVSGYWEFTGSKTDIYSADKNTLWDNNSDLIVATSTWIDMLKIEHTVSSSFKWEQPPQRLMPGSDNKISGNYINNEYSTPNRVLTGLRILIDRTNEAFSEANAGSTEILKVLKDNKQHVSEVKTGFFSAPKFFRGDTREIRLLVDCYIGKDHYVTTYTYNWIESSSL